MKNIHKLLLTVLSLLPGALVYGAPWGALADFDLPVQPDADAPKTMGERYLLPQILAGKPVRIFVDAPGASDKDYAKYQEILAKSYNKWFTGTADVIRSAKREQEFADIMPLLQKGVNVEFVDHASAADIWAHILPWSEVRWKCGPSAGGCYQRREGETPDLFLPKDHFVLKVLSSGQLGLSRVGLHEVGHSLGLSDQYDKAKDSTSHHRYSSAQSGKGVMSSLKKFSCDDADGIVNLIDLVRGVARGGNTGWKSLCPKSQDYYIRSQSALRSPYVLSLQEDNSLLLEIYQNGEKHSAQTYTMASQGAFLPLIPAKETVLQRDKFGRPLLSQGPHGEKIYYYYVFEAATRMAVLNGKALWLSQHNFVWNGRKKMDRTTFFFNQNGAFVTTGVVVSKNKGGSAFYIEENEAENRGLLVKLAFDKKGNFHVIEWREAYGIVEASAKKKQGDKEMSVASQAIRRQVEHHIGVGTREKIKSQLAKWYQIRQEQVKK